MDIFPQIFFSQLKFSKWLMRGIGIAEEKEKARKYCPFFFSFFSTATDRKNLFPRLVYESEFQILHSIPIDLVFSSSFTICLFFQSQIRKDGGVDFFAEKSLSELLSTFFTH